MAITLIKKKKENSDEMHNIMFKTYYEKFDEKEILILSIMIVDDYLKDLSKPLIYDISELKEEEFHKKFRNEAAQHGHLITSHSTNPEWNPENYSKNLNEEL